MGTRRMVCLLVGGLLALAVSAARPTAGTADVALGADERAPCWVHNVSQDTRGLGFDATVDAAHDGDRIRVRGTCASHAVMDVDLDIAGIDEAATLHGNWRGRVIKVRAGASVTIRDLRLGGGIAPYTTLPFGGGVYNRGTLRLIDSGVFANQAYSGGGIYNVGSLTLVRSRVSHHGYPRVPVQGSGGGIYNTGTAMLVDSRVTKNGTDHAGAGIYNEGTLTLRRSRISGNHSWLGSGGIVNTGTLRLIGSVVSGNEGRDAGIRSTGTLVLIRSAVTGNSGWGGGGGIFNGQGGRLVLRDGSSIDRNTGFAPGGLGGGIFNRGLLIVRGSTITENEAAFEGGGIFNARRGRVTLHGASSVTGNVPDDCVGTAAC